MNGLWCPHSNFWYEKLVVCLFARQPAIELLMLVMLHTVRDAILIDCSIFGFYSWNFLEFGKFSALHIALSPLPHFILVVWLLRYSHQLPLWTSRVKIFCTTKQSKAKQSMVKRTEMHLLHSVKWSHACSCTTILNELCILLQSTAIHTYTLLTVRCMCVCESIGSGCILHRDEIGACTEFTWNIDPICY